MAMMVPTVEFPLATPFTDQVTVVGKFPAPETVAVKTCAPFAGTEALPGARLTWRVSVTVTRAEAVACGLAWLTAVTVTVAGLGRFAGAV